MIIKDDAYNNFVTMALNHDVDDVLSGMSFKSEYLDSLLAFYPNLTKDQIDSITILLESSYVRGFKMAGAMLLSEINK